MFIGHVSTHKPSSYFTEHEVNSRCMKNYFIKSRIQTTIFNHIEINIQKNKCNGEEYCIKLKKKVLKQRGTDCRVNLALRPAKDLKVLVIVRES